MKRFRFLVFLVFIVGCKYANMNKHLVKQLEKPTNQQHFSGVFVYDPTEKDTIFNYNGDRYFTPASNTKIATLFTALQLLQDKIPAYTYAVNADTIAIQGTGNPTLLHPYFKDSSLVNFIKDFKNVKIHTGNLKDRKYGYGWAWEDFDAYYNPERTSFPLFGNVVSITNNGTTVSPKVFQNTVVIGSKKGREETKNTFYYRKNSRKDVEIPFMVDSSSLKKLWKEVLPNQNLTFSDKIANFKDIKYSDIPLDSVYKRMMIESDNFLAEQLLIMASSSLSDTLSSSKARKYILQNQLADLPHKPRWVDGSGLSRYNLFTPSSFVFILDRIYASIPEERLFELFPKGGVSGTIKDVFKGKNEPYIIAKSGALGNNYNLSGFLKTKSGKTLIFSFMNNHFRKRSKDIKAEMETVFKYLHDNY